VEYWLELQLAMELLAVDVGLMADSEVYCFYPDYWNLQQKTQQKQWLKVLGKVDLTCIWDQMMRMVPCQESSGTVQGCKGEQMSQVKACGVWVTVQRTLLRLPAADRNPGKVQMLWTGTE
jgi:hypothetical protein